MSIVLSEIFNDVRSVFGCEEIMFPVNPKKVILFIGYFAMNKHYFNFNHVII